MKRRRLLGMAAVALALAGLLSLMFYRMLGQSKRRSAPALVGVVAAARAVPPGQPLQPGDLKLVRVPQAALPAQTYSRRAQLNGKVLTSAAVRNQILVGAMIAAPGAGAGLPPLIPPGMRAVSVKVNDVVSVAGFAVPGTHVDVLLTGNPSTTGDPRAVATVTLLSNVQVLTAGQQLERDTSGKPEKVAVMTLLVTPEGAEKLALAEGYGHIQLALRNPLDRVQEHTAPVLSASLYGRPVRPPRLRPRVRAAAAPKPARTAPTAWSVNVIVGHQQQRVAFPALTLGGGRQ